MLGHPHADKPTARTVDASGTAVGAVLEQNSDGSDWKPVAFFSRKLRPAEQNYSSFNRELLPRIWLFDTSATYWKGVLSRFSQTTNR